MEGSSSDEKTDIFFCVNVQFKKSLAIFVISPKITGFRLSPAKYACSPAAILWVFA
jgi:hypothetical protein